MLAKEGAVLSFLRGSPQFVIPIYQRTYSWTERECEQLWVDVIRSGRTDSVKGHFMGSLVCIEAGPSAVMYQSPRLVIDGQQRLTTVSLLIAALAEAVGESEPLDGFSARKLRNYHLLNQEESGERRFKLILSQTDKASLIAIAQGAEPPKDGSARIAANFAMFRKWIGGADVVTVCKGLAKLTIVEIALTRDQDNPQLIFESMNSTGRELSQADLIRNFVLMGLEPELQTRLYEQYWRPMEVDFGQEAYVTHFDDFMRHYLTVKTGSIPNVSEVYDEFKTYARSASVAERGWEPLVQDIRRYSRFFCAMALNAEEDTALKVAFHDLRELKVDVAYPFLLDLYASHVGGALSKAEFVQIVRMIESYVFRRAVCSVPTNSMNKTFATFSKAIKKDRILESVQGHFLWLQSYRRFPDDEEFRRELPKRDLYNFRSRSYWLRRLENHGRKERVPVDEYTIEHIMPQNKNLSAEWRKALGPEWERVHATWLHTLGNLTLTGYNSEYSDRPFAEKRDMEKGFRVSPLKLNAGLGAREQWDEEAIQERAAALADVALEVWSSPRLSEEVLLQYRPKSSQAVTYTIDDHADLFTPELRLLFEALRKDILALDPCVSEEFVKYYKRYVSYKAERSFVDVHPRTASLRLTLDLPFADIDDPREICKQSDGGRRTKFRIAGLSDVPYAIGLVRRALERQLGNGADA